MNGNGVGKVLVIKKDGSMRHFLCPTCGNHIISSDGYRGSGEKTNYCPDCGQKFDWDKTPDAKWL